MIANNCTDNTAEAARAGWDEAIRGNGSDSAFVRWLTRKPLPIKMSGYRIVCSIVWAFYAFAWPAGSVGIISGLSGGTAFFAFIFGALSAYYDWRIWTRRASRLTLPIIF